MGHPEGAGKTNNAQLGFDRCVWLEFMAPRSVLTAVFLSPLSWMTELAFTIRRVAFFEIRPSAIASAAADAVAPASHGTNRSTHAPRIKPWIKLVTMELENGIFTK